MRRSAARGRGWLDGCPLLGVLDRARDVNWQPERAATRTARTYAVVPDAWTCPFWVSDTQEHRFWCGSWAEEDGNMRPKVWRRSQGRSTGNKGNPRRVLTMVRAMVSVEIREIMS